MFSKIVEETNVNMKRGFCAVSRALLTLAGLLWLSVNAHVFAAEPSAPPAPQTVFLDYHEFPSGVAQWNIPVALQTVPFKKEPALSQTNPVFRGTLKFGNSTEHFVPFILDRPHRNRTLYLDLNRNQDLTDDTNGVFLCADTNLGPYYTPFYAIPLTFKTPAGIERVRLDLTFLIYGKNEVHVSVVSHSWWEGKVELKGRQYQLALADDLSRKPGSPQEGWVLLRPWMEPNQIEIIQSPTLPSFPFVPTIYVDQQTYHTEWAVVPSNDANPPRCKVEIQPQPSELGDLKVTGKYVHRLLMKREGNDPVEVVLGEPAPLEKVPRGVYSCTFIVDQGGMAALPRDKHHVVVGGTNAALLTIGGPLTNSVSVTREGENLSLTYQLLGVNGDAYGLWGVRKEPELAIYRGDKKLFADKFRFG
jgi:hypothetical protein